MIKLIPCVDFSFKPEPPYKSNTKNNQKDDKDWIPKSLSTGYFFASDKRKGVWKIKLKIDIPTISVNWPLR